jgi:hypothetical protein
MSWDREWASAEEPEPGPVIAAGPRGHAFRVAVGVALALALVAAVIAAGQLPRSDPLVPALHFDLPGLHRNIHLTPAAAEFGSTYTLEGTTPHGREGLVVVDGSWNGGASRRLAEGRTTGGAYRLRFPLRRHGTLALRVTYPGGRADGTVIVP